LGTTTALCASKAHVASGDDGAARLYRLGSEEPVAVWPGALVTALAFDPSGRLLAIGRVNGVVEVRRSADGALVSGAAKHASEVRSLAFRADGAVLAVAAPDDVRLLRMSDWGCAAVLKDVRHPTQLTWAGTRLFVADQDGCVVFELPVETHA
jgi:WD40 repeat protein